MTAPSVFTGADKELLDHVTPARLAADPHSCFVAAAQRMGMGLREISDVKVVESGVLIQTFDGGEYLVVPADNPDAHGKVGLMSARPLAENFPFYAAHDAWESHDLETIEELATVAVVDVRRRTVEKSIQRFERLPRISQADELVLRGLKTELATLNERREELIAEREAQSLATSGDSVGIRSLR